MYKNTPLKSLLEGTKKEFNTEIIKIRQFKEMMEYRIGESIGQIIDPDGREI